MEDRTRGGSTARLDSKGKLANDATCDLFFPKPLKSGLNVQLYKYDQSYICLDKAEQYVSISIIDTKFVLKLKISPKAAKRPS